MAIGKSLGVIPAMEFRGFVDGIKNVASAWAIATRLTHHNSEHRLAGNPCLLVKPKLLDHMFVTFR